MNDAEYVFHTTNSERKRNGCGDYHKKRRGGRNVRLGSDNLTRKEWEKMNGEVITVELDQPRTWEEYKELPDNYRKDYLNFLISKYSPSKDRLARMFGIAYSNFCKEWDRLGMPKPGYRGRSSDQQLRDWAVFINNYGEKPATKEKPEPEPKIPPLQVVDQSIRAELRKMFGPGVKFTIEVIT